MTPAELSQAGAILGLILGALVWRWWGRRRARKEAAAALARERPPEVVD